MNPCCEKTLSEVRARVENLKAKVRKDIDKHDELLRLYKNGKMCVEFTQGIKHSLDLTKDVNLKFERGLKELLASLGDGKK